MENGNFKWHIYGLKQRGHGTSATGYLCDLLFHLKNLTQKKN